MVREIDPALFRFHVIRAAQTLRAPLRFSIDLLDLATYAAARCFYDENAMAGFAVTEAGRLVSVFSRAKGQGDALTRAAIAAGARTLDVFDTPVADLYRRHGFREVARYPFDPALADSRWIVEHYGAPDVIEMELTRPTD